MSTQTGSEAAPLRVVLDQQSGPAFAPDRKHSLLRSLLEGGYAVTASSEASESAGAVAPLDDAELLVLREDGSAADGVEAEGEVGVEVRGIAGLDDAAVLGLVRDKASGRRAPGEWKPWFPVIDYDRCTNCMQCLSFCLFGVYDVDDDRQIDVAQPEKCKTNCPACSRVCPEVAILFPKYKNGPINGDVVQAQDIEREKMKIDISSLLGGDIYSMLRDRHARANTRFSKERDDERALKERQRCLAKLQKDLDIPDDVLGQLPSAEQIQQRASAAARAKGLADDDAKS
ncbi:MAG: ferredoxin family protein [Acidobacteriota bacterium]